LATVAPVERHFGDKTNEGNEMTKTKTRVVNLDKSSPTMRGRWRTRALCLDFIERELRAGRSLSPQLLLEEIRESGSPIDNGCLYALRRDAWSKLKGRRCPGSHRGAKRFSYDVGFLTPSESLHLRSRLDGTPVPAFCDLDDGLVSLDSSSRMESYNMEIDRVAQPMLIDVERAAVEDFSGGSRDVLQIRIPSVISDKFRAEAAAARMAHGAYLERLLDEEGKQREWWANHKKAQEPSGPRALVEVRIDARADKPISWGILGYLMGIIGQHSLSPLVTRDDNDNLTIKLNPMETP
tara:strand:+ start:311 stop:1195 length:885 start_codon:yes stop_codon:yes gene_type:complete